MGKRAKQSFAFSLSEGINQVVSEDDEYDDDHPFVTANPGQFMDIQDNPHRIKTPQATPKRAEVEQATAAPGETRGAVKPKK